MQNIEGHSLIYVRLMNFWPFDCCGLISNIVQFHLGRFFFLLHFWYSSYYYYYNQYYIAC